MSNLLSERDTYYAKLNHDFEIPKVNMGIEGLGNEVYCKKLCIYL
jgi:hypothetical protein